MNMRGCKLTDDALARLENAIARNFPYTKHHLAKIYQGAPGYCYNFVYLRRQIQLDCESNFLMTRDTLQRILCRTQGVDVKSIKALFDALKEPLEETDYVKQHKEVAPSQQKLARSALSRKLCNLPAQDYTQFIGRHAELRNLLKYISPEYRGHIITVDGIGGVGKTTLVVEAAYLCWEAKHGQSMLNAPVYDAIVFTTFKNSYLLPDGVISCTQWRRNKLGEIFRTIAEVLDDQSITRADSDEQWSRAYASLHRQKTLLIVDDLQTLSLEEQNEVIAFLSDLPFGTKAVITTRKRRIGYSAIRLDCLTEEESLRLIEQLVAHKEGIATISSEVAMRLHHCFW